MFKLFLFIINNIKKTISDKNIKKLMPANWLLTYKYTFKYEEVWKFFYVTSNYCTNPMFCFRRILHCHWSIVLPGQIVIVSRRWPSFMLLIGIKVLAKDGLISCGLIVHLPYLTSEQPRGKSFIIKLFLSHNSTIQYLNGKKKKSYNVSVSAEYLWNI